MDEAACRAKLAHSPPVVHADLHLLATPGPPSCSLGLRLAHFGAAKLLRPVGEAAIHAELTIATLEMTAEDHLVLVRDLVERGLQLLGPHGIVRGALRRDCVVETAIGTKLAPAPKVVAADLLPTDRSWRPRGGRQHCVDWRYMGCWWLHRLIRQDVAKAAIVAELAVTARKVAADVLLGLGRWGLTPRQRGLTRLSCSRKVHVGEATIGAKAAAAPRKVPADLACRHAGWWRRGCRGGRWLPAWSPELMQAMREAAVGTELAMAAGEVATQLRLVLERSGPGLWVPQRLRAGCTPRRHNHGRGLGAHVVGEAAGIPELADTPFEIAAEL
mmetsp:Transcript_113895/g.368001  ORF Transcript_113895/g.368001 Transcript_113895/m.368001 type:complete len:330 (+) Transcript_113895:435-1424(+)